MTVPTEPVPIPVTEDDLQAYVGGSDDDRTDYARDLATATALVAQHVGATAVPDAVLRSAILEVGAKLVMRRQSPTADFDGAVAIAPRDPMVTAYPLLAPFLAPGFA